MSGGDKARWIFLDLRRSGVVYATHQVLYLHATPQGVTRATLLFIYRFFFFSLLFIENFCHLIFNHLDSTRRMRFGKKISIQFTCERYDTITLFCIHKNLANYIILYIMIIS